MAGRCGCAGSGCACCFDSGATEVVFAGNGSEGNCITGSLRYSADAGNAAHAGTDGGLMVNPGVGGVGSVTALVGGGGHGADVGTDPAPVGLVHIAPAAGAGVTGVMADDVVSITNPGAADAAVTVLIRQPMLAIVESDATHDALATVMHTITATLAGSIGSDGARLADLRRTLFAPQASGVNADYGDTPVLFLTFTLAGGATATVTVTGDFTCNIVSKATGVSTAAVHGGPRIIEWAMAGGA